MTKFYKDRRWIRKRENILRRDGYKCRHCSRYGKTTVANTVHHIYPLDEHPSLGLVNDNLLSLCLTCHGKMHNRITNEITTIGIEWQERVSNKLTIHL